MWSGNKPIQIHESQSVQSRSMPTSLWVCLKISPEFAILIQEYIQGAIATYYGITTSHGLGQLTTQSWDAYQDQTMKIRVGD